MSSASPSLQREARPRSLTNARTSCREARTLSGAFRVYLRFATPRILAVSACVWLVARLFVGSWGVGDLLVALAICVYWPLQEWFAHAYILHLKPRDIGSLRLDPYFARVHRWHHRHPDIVERIFVPWELILVLTPIHAALWLGLAPSLSLALSGGLFFTLAALLYEWVHFLVHMPYRPKTSYFQRVKSNHMVHHYRNEHYWHAFTCPLVDDLMGTNPDPKEVPRSPTVRTLGVDDEREREATKL